MIVRDTMTLMRRIGEGAIPVGKEILTTLVRYASTSGRLKKKPDVKLNGMLKRRQKG